MVTPEFLRPGDRIAMISPATRVKTEYVEGAQRFLSRRGYRAEIAPHAIGAPAGSFAASLSDRLDDFMTALTDREVKVIFCNRGGYGVQQLLPLIPPRLVAENPKWIVGFSDISAFHALWNAAGVRSLHAPMAKHLTEHPDSVYTATLMDILEGRKASGITADGDSRNREGAVTGTLGGGNLAVLDGLAATTFDLLNADPGRPDILFIEDIAENIYKVDRMLTRLWLTGALRRAKALIVGEFTEYKEDLNYSTMYDMIHDRITTLGVDIPVAYGFPVGHGARNFPLMEGADVKVEITKEKICLSYL